MHPSPSSVIPTKGDSARYSNGSNFSDDEAGIFMTIDNEKGTEFFAIEPPRAVLTKDNSQKERQISVDPISLQGSSTIRQASFRLVSPPTNPNKGLGHNNPPLPAPPPKLKFVSTSLPSSTSSSPESASKKIDHKNNDQHAAAASRNNLSRIHSVMDDSHLEMAEANTRKSKSLGEGRTSGPTDDFDLWLEKSGQNPRRDHGSSINSSNNNNSNKYGGFSKPPLGPGNVDRHHSTMKKSKSRDPNFQEDKFKCGKLCLFLPRGKGKTVRSISSTSTMTQASSKTEPMAISRRVSLEKFECGSWASTSSLELEEGESANLFFDLPVELLRCSVSDMQSPVTAAFVFDNDEDNGENKDKDKEKDIQMDFHAFLEAQS
ncbi:hypothetical protein BVRB_4g077050 [Beta vulgaris subsp. vulgaris]|uniref:uncharacterized protein LOC104890693 n=1 Tax=Beta vulgaris subsp. vulgaris TaxID=3555 RepID=UPI00053FCA5C|nr:uncharacterized protein LOC104890693 [Beta vulgaris subsp. vulgaris]KMT13862.1 hypothetical protein BVRB_4g077050 [Beta vulgaris subsp. vulgaris]